MREQKIYNMTDRELRAYRWKQRRMRKFRKRVLSVAMKVCLLASCVLFYHAISSSANSGADEVSFKYYARVTVHSGDTLWSISDDYIDYDQYRNKNAYIEEVCSINGIYEDDTLHAGQTLVVPYYSSEFVK